MGAGAQLPFRGRVVLARVVVDARGGDVPVDLGVEVALGQVERKRGDTAQCDREAFHRAVVGVGGLGEPRRPGGPLVGEEMPAALLPGVVRVGGNFRTAEVVVLLEVRRRFEGVARSQRLKPYGLVAARIVGARRRDALLFVQGQVEKCVRRGVERVHRGARHAVAFDGEEPDLLGRLTHGRSHAGAASRRAGEESPDVDERYAVHVSLESSLIP